VILCSMAMYNVADVVVVWELDLSRMSKRNEKISNLLLKLDENRD